MKYDVFISYSRKDYVDANKQVIPGNIVSQIKTLFDKNGISYWFDEEGIYSGDAFARVIARNIKASKMLLFISTANSNQSQWTSDEIAVAREYGKKIIPFRYDQSHYNEDVIIYIARLDYIDYLANPKVALNRLLSSVKEFLQTESQKEIEKKRAEEQRIMEERLINERAKRVQVIDDSIVKYKDELRSIEQSIIECEKSLLELKYKRDKLNASLKELSDEKIALLSFVSQPNNKNVDKTSWDVYMKSPGLAKLQVTKAIRDTMGLTTLSEASQIVYRTPCYVARNKSKSVATQIIKALMDAGAEVELR